MPFTKNWCCKTPDNIWAHYNDDPPCEVMPGCCPMEGAELTPLNQFLMMRWTAMDFTSRSRGMQEEPLREEAIDTHLKRYNCNTPTAYETILKIEAALFSDRARKREKERKKSESSKAKNQHQQMKR